jgi:hypothetical protein
MNLDRRQAWPALAIMGIGILTLALTLKSAQHDMPVQPQWIMAAVAALYAGLALVAEGFRWQSPVVFVAMLAAHAFMALLCGWGYSALEGTPRELVPAFQHGLWDYLPGTALQFGFSCLLGIVLDVSLEPRSEPAVCEPETVAVVATTPLPDLAAVTDPQAALDAVLGVKGVAGALLAGPDARGSGAWARDPQAAAQRVQALVARGGSGLHSIPVGGVSLLTRAENGRLVALLVTPAISQGDAHELLRVLWAVGQQAAGEPA